MKNVLIEELNQFSYLTQYKRGVVISEQEKKEVFYSLAGLPLKIKDGRILAVNLKNKTEIIETVDLNGVLDNFKVDLKTGKILDPTYIKNKNIVDEVSNDLYRMGKTPLQSNTRYQFVAVIPKGQENAGQPKVYRADIKETGGDVTLDVLIKNGYTESTDGSISPKTYIKKGRNDASYLKLYPGGQPLDILNTDIPTPEITKTPVPQYDTVDVKLDLEAPFEFGKTTLTGDAEIKFQEFLQKLNQSYRKIPGKVEVIATSSIDSNPDEIVKGGITRKEADLILSQKRAQTIVDRIKNAVPEIKLEFIPKGIGQTDQFAPGKKFPDVKDPKETAPNRRLIIKLPQYKMLVKK